MQNVLAVISLNRIVNNARALAREAQGKKLYAVVKDDAYGHGAAAVAHALEGAVSAFAVATVDEGAALRTAGVNADILVLTPALCKEEAVRLSAYGLIASVSSRAALNVLLRANVKVRAHISINTGMNRYGVKPALIDGVCRDCKAAGIQVEGVYSHYYCAESTIARREQRRRFLTACAAVKQYFPNAERHISASGGLLAGDEFDAVRVGISLYGYPPAGFEDTLGLKPALKIYATVAHSAKQIGGGAGYTCVRRNYGKLHTLRIGYGDGLFRESLHGAVGVLCMDAVVMRGGARFGRRKLVVSDVSAYAASHGTTTYEALLKLTQKAVKVYR